MIDDAMAIAEQHEGQGGIGPFNCVTCGRFSRHSWLTHYPEGWIWGGICPVHGPWSDGS